MPRWELLSEQQQANVTEAMVGYLNAGIEPKQVYETIRQALGIGD